MPGVSGGAVGGQAVALLALLCCCDDTRLVHVGGVGGWTIAVCGHGCGL